MGLSSKEFSVDNPNWSQIEGLEIPNPTGEANNQNQQAPHLNCPRCDSTNTKFCYYNNYSRLQPRHFCRACRRHWTAGGTLRNVPVGGNRKNKRAKTSHTSTEFDANIDSSSTIQAQQQVAVPFSTGMTLDSSSNIFSNVFRQVLYHHPLPLPQLDCSIGGLVDSVLTVPEPVVSPCDDAVNPFSTISTSPSCSSPDGVLNMMDGFNSPETGWFQDPAVNYWSSWDGLGDMGTALKLNNQLE